MTRTKFPRIIVLVIGWVLLTAVASLAQSANALQLNLRRNFGLGIGANIQGTFSMRVEGPANLTGVTFLIDEQPIATISDPPYQVQFRTDNFAPGPHILRAAGVTNNGQELTSNTLTRNFLTAGESVKATLWILIPILAIALGGRWLSNRIARRGRTQSPADIPIDGMFGGAICPQCKRPFARHWWGLNIVIGKFDRCPHCGKWSVVQSVHPDILEASLAAMKQADAQESATAPPHNDSEDAYRRRLDNSRFDQ